MIYDGIGFGKVAKEVSLASMISYESAVLVAGSLICALVVYLFGS